MTHPEHRHTTDSAPDDAELEVQRAATHAGLAPEPGSRLPDPNDPGEDPVPPVRTRRWTIIAALIILLIALIMTFWR